MQTNLRKNTRVTILPNHPQSPSKLSICNINYCSHRIRMTRTATQMKNQWSYACKCHSVLEPHMCWNGNCTTIRSQWRHSYKCVGSATAQHCVMFVAALCFLETLPKTTPQSFQSIRCDVRHTARHTCQRVQRVGHRDGFLLTWCGLYLWT